LREKHWLRISANGVLRIFGLIWEDVTGNWRDFIKRRFRTCTKYYCDEQIIQKQMGGACGTYVEDEKRIQGFSGATRGKKKLLENLGVDREDKIKEESSRNRREHELD